MRTGYANRTAATRAALAVLAALAAFPRDLLARPVPTLHPGGAGPEPAAVVIDYPVRLAPSLLSLRATGPLWLGGMAPVPADTLTLVRRMPAAPPRSALAPAGPPRDAIVFNGTKSVSVEVGRGRSATLQQSLDLSLRGKIGGDVEIAALLSDQNLPFEPDGTSRELADLDRLSITLRSSRGEATMGDFVLEGAPGQYGRITRHLQGVRGSASAVGARWNVAAAGAKGTKRSVQIQGEEGRQGPYPLLSRGVAAAAAGVVAGSEAVWMDGARLKRGADADYVIDYGSGTVTFTVRRPVLGHSRIAVDFEEAAGSYRRSFYAATTQGPLRQSGSWFANYMKEGDDSKSASAGDLSVEDRETLSAMGDSTSAAGAGGVRYVGPGSGTYAWDQSDPARPHWVYLGAGRGDYEVTFAGVGAGLGEYADTLGSDATRFYVYRGVHQGSFAPGHALAAPSGRTLVDAGGSMRAGAVTVEAEAARSGLDRNLLSSADDGDNAGTAGRVAVRLDPRRVSVGGARLGTLGASVLVRAQDERFQPFDRVDPAFEGERWNQRDGGAGEARHEVALRYAPRAGVAINADWGRRALSGGSRSIRRAAQAAVAGPVAGSIYWEEARNSLGAEDGRRARWGFEIARERGAFLPRVSAREERVAGQEGDSADTRRSREVNLGLQVAPGPSVRVRGGYGIRLDGVVWNPGAPEAVHQARTVEGGVVARAGAGLSLDAGFTHRRIEGSLAQGTDLAQLVVLAGRPGGPVTSELRYTVTQLREAEIVRRFVPVGEGNGAYDFYGNPRWGGGYELVSSVGDPVPRSRAAVELRLDAYPGRATAPRGRPPFWRGLGASSFLRVETLSSLPLGNPLHAADPSAYLAPATTIRGFAAARQTFEFTPASRRYDARLELGFRRERNGEYEDLESLRDAADGRLTLRHALPGRLRARETVSADRVEQSVQRVESGAGIEALTRGHGLEVEVTKQLSPTWSASLLAQHRRSADLTHGGVLGFRAAGPTAHCAAGTRLRLDGRLLLGTTTVEGAYQPPGLYVVPALGRRIDYDLLGAYRLRERISLSMGVNGVKAPGAPSLYTGRFDVRGSF
jgi:hypothetical protein